MLLSHARPWIIAHRGVPFEAPENTMKSYAAAIGHGADLLEIDLHLSADKQLVVIHDATLDRTTNGTGRVDQFSLEELLTLDAGSWMGPMHCGERIPTLSNVIDLTAEDVGIVVDLKHGSDRYAGIEQLLVHAIEASQRLADVIVISRNSAALQTINALNPDVMTLDFGHVPLASSEWDNAEPLTRPGKRFVFTNASQVDAKRIKHMQDLGYHVWSSIADQDSSPPILENLLASPVDGIITDDVLELKRALGR